MNAPNALSFLRILLLPFFIYYFLKGNWTAAVVILTVSGLSDFLDGFIARKFSQITELGKILDPMADKLTQAAVAICMSIHWPILIPLLSIFLIKEIFMLCGSIILFRKGLRPSPAKWYGKVATGFFYISMLVIILLEALDRFNFILTVVLTIISAALMLHAFIRYILVFLSLSRQAPPKSEKQNG